MRIADAITFTVDTVSASGYDYSSSLNIVSSISIETQEISNQGPVAIIEAGSLTGFPPLFYDHYRFCLCV